MAKTKNKAPRPRNSGMFEKGNTIGFNTRFQPGNAITSKYEEDFPESLLQHYQEYEGLPTLGSWALAHNIDVRTVKDWVAQNKHPRFSLAYAQCLEIQRQKLVDLGLADAYNATLVKFLLINNHGMKDKIETEQSQASPFEVNINVTKK